jgi:hypothetical protein
LVCNSSNHGEDICVCWGYYCIEIRKIFNQLKIFLIFFKKIHNMGKNRNCPACNSTNTREDIKIPNPTGATEEKCRKLLCNCNDKTNCPNRVVVAVYIRQRFCKDCGHYYT